MLPLVLESQELFASFAGRIVQLSSPLFLTVSFPPVSYDEHVSPDSRFRSARRFFLVALAAAEGAGVFNTK